MHKKPLYAVIITALLSFPLITILSTSALAYDDIKPVKTERGTLSVDDNTGSKPEGGADKDLRKLLRNGTTRESDGVLSVALPVSYDFIVDPSNALGHGQIFSDEYILQNHSDTDVCIIITDFKIIFPNETDFIALPSPYDPADGETRKAVYMELNYNIPGQEPIVINSAAQRSVEQDEYPPLFLSAAGEESSICTVTVGGSVNPSPAVKWQKGDVRISVSYRVDTFDNYLASLTSGNENTDNDITDLAVVADDPSVIADDPSVIASEAKQSIQLQTLLYMLENELAALDDAEEAETVTDGEESETEPEPIDAEQLTAIILDLIATPTSLDTTIDEDENEDEDEDAWLLDILDILPETIEFLTAFLTDLADIETDNDTDEKPMSEQISLLEQLIAYFEDYVTTIAELQELTLTESDS